MKEYILVTSDKLSIGSIIPNSATHVISNNLEVKHLENHGELISRDQVEDLLKDYPDLLKKLYVLPIYVDSSASLKQLVR